MLKEYQKRVIKDIEEFFEHLDKSRAAADDYVSSAFGAHPKYRQYPDRPITGKGVLYPRVCIKMPTGGGKKLIAIENINTYHKNF